MTIVSFSSGIVNLCVAFVAYNPKNGLILCIASFVLSYALNQEIIESDDNELNEYDETF
jgi:hypothetical protein